jgi:small-conductance mechanosensitive channel
VIERSAVVGLGALYSGSVINAILISGKLTSWTLADRTRRFEEWAAIHSQVAVAANAALKAAGIDMPFPQRDVTLRFRPQEEM